MHETVPDIPAVPPKRSWWPVVRQLPLLVVTVILAAAIVVQGERISAVQRDLTHADSRVTALQGEVAALRQQPAAMARQAAEITALRAGYAALRARLAATTRTGNVITCTDWHDAALQYTDGIDTSTPGGSSLIQMPVPDPVHCLKA